MKKILGIKELKKIFTKSLRNSNISNQMVQDGIFKIFGKKMSVSEVCSGILNDIEEDGDLALRKLCEKLDGSNLENFQVSEKLINRSLDQISPKIINSLEVAADRIKDFQMNIMPSSWFNKEKGLGEIVRPIERVLCYVPGGLTPLVSTVLMTAIPAKIAGVKEVIVTSPVKNNMNENPHILAACKISGVDKVFNIGGAQAIAAFALGTETIPKVDLICGPGNIFVTEMKKKIFGKVGIDGLFGPTETMIIADEKANPELCAADLIAQAEHDQLAFPILVTNSLDLLNNVEELLIQQLNKISRGDIAGKSLQNRGMSILVSDINEAIEVANFIAPEHLSLLVDDPEIYIKNLNNLGGLFLGEVSGEVIGDYIAGPSHVMPTEGSAKFASSLSVRNFLKFIPIVNIKENDLALLSNDVINLAQLEDLQGHAEAAKLRKKIILED
ncbi:MAG: histidinol dehydrogenase [Chloroflexi bacterium]|nr:histidinol dehydrogenase [Chloroflexota bacterium]|tara:strand:+ start:7207 stop:8535 length:1329 start_codon:yes stop_codon:yes gene_type:complete